MTLLLDPYHDNDIELLGGSQGSAQDLRVTTPEPEQASGAAHPAGSLIVNRYRLEDNVPLGTGSMGEVWRATDTLLNRVVALKQIRLTGIDEHTAAEVRQRTLHEGRVAAQLVHRRTTLPSGETVEESANISVHAAVPPDQQCHLATDLAAKLIPRLPAG
jgi:hypothetical protein